MWPAVPRITGATPPPQFRDRVYRAPTRRTRAGGDRRPGVHARTRAGDADALSLRSRRRLDAPLRTASREAPLERRPATCVRRAPHAYIARTGHRLRDD